MDKQSEQHLSDIVTHLAFEIDKKYRKGKKEHGGQLWDKPGMLKMLMAELYDAPTYGFTLNQQLRQVLEYQLKDEHDLATKLMQQILSEPND